MTKRRCDAGKGCECEFHRHARERQRRYRRGERVGKSWTQPEKVGDRGVPLEGFCRYEILAARGMA